MTLVNADTGEIVETLTRVDAERLTNRIRLLAESLADTLDKLADLIDQARVGSAWLAMGYKSWTAYVAAEFDGVLPRLDREPRQEFVRELAARGMSSRSIAPVVGATDRTVRRDMTGGTDVPPAPKVAAGARGEGDGRVESRFESEAPSPTPPAPVIGLDGKTYTRPEPIDHEAKAAQAVERYPDLAWQYDQGDYEHCWRLADKLDDYAARGELAERLATLRRSNEIAEAKANGTYVPATPEPRTCPTCGQTVRN